MAPKLVQGARAGGLRNFFAELRRQIIGAQRSFGGNRLVRSQGQIRNLDRTRGRGRLLPGLIAAEREYIRENSGGGDKVGRIARCTMCAQQLQWDGSAVGDETCEKAACVADLLERRLAARGAHYGFNKRRSRRNNLRLRSKLYEPGGVDPTAKILGRLQGFACLVPAFESGIAQLRNRVR